MFDRDAEQVTSRMIIIAGGGIGGLALALALHRRSIPCTVLEASREVRPLGVGINLLPHAVRALQGIDVADDLRAGAIETADLSYYNRHGQLIWTEPRGTAAGYAAPQLSIHRGVLHTILHSAVLDRLGSSAIQLGHCVTGFETDHHGVTVRVLDRNADETPTVVRGAALVGADGIHSAVRATLHPSEGAPRFSGRMLWRGITHGPPFLAGRSMIMAGHDQQKFVCYPIAPVAAGAQAINWVAELAVEGEAPPPQDWSRQVPSSRFRSPFADWRFDWLDVPALIDGALAIFEFPMSDRDPLGSWGSGRVTLLGDAAHPMYPIGSNGASQAILDAESLARHLADASPERAFSAYEAERRPPTTKITLMNREFGPERVMTLAEERAPDGFDDIERVIPRWELESIAATYKQVAGFTTTQVNA